MFKIIFALLFPVFASAKMIKIAVVDTGYSNFVKLKDVPLCSGLHADFTQNRTFMKEPPADQNSARHGTNIAWLIRDNINESFQDKYCIIIINYFADNEKDSLISTSNLALQYAVDVGADIINYSGGGIEENETETRIIKRALNKGVIVVAAAGNEGKDFKEQKYYPALSDSRVVVVGNIDRKGERVSSSNFGPGIDRWEMGHRVSAGGVTLTGTSQSTAIATGKIVNQIITEALRDVIQRMRNTANVKGSKDGKPDRRN